MNVTTGIPTAELARRGADEVAKFARRADNDPQACFELFRRALVEQSDEAFTHVYRIFEPLVTGWVYRQSRFALTGESAEYFTSAAFRSFYFALRGERLSRCPTLAALLGYLKVCVYSAIAQYLREESRHGTVPLEDATELVEVPALDGHLEADEIWTHICRLLPDERDQLLARCAFAQHLTPRLIRATYGAYWRDERAVSVDLYRIRRRLRADPELAILAGWAAPA
jgi:hypothetical protein